MNDDLTLLASTYLDGEATPDERARVEADPALLDEVERLRNVRATLADGRWFERPGDDTREASITAALAAWDASAAGLTQPAPSHRTVSRPAPVVSFRRRPAYSRWLAAAAAVVAVAGLGVVVAQSGGTGGDESSDASEAASATVADGETDALLTEQTESPSAMEDSQLRAEPPADTQAADDGADADAITSAEAAPDETSAAGAAPAIDYTTAADVNLESPADLATYAVEAEAAAQDGTERDVPARPCPDDVFDDIDSYVAVATYRGQPVVIGIDEQRQEAFAIDPDSCEIAAQAPLP